MQFGHVLRQPLRKPDHPFVDVMVECLMAQRIDRGGTLQRIIK